MAQQVTTHTVAPGETLASIASKYGVSVEALTETNPETKKHLYTGMSLAIPSVKKNHEQPVVIPDPTPTPIKKEEVTYSTTTSNDVTYKAKEGNAGKLGVAMEILFGYLIPSLGDASDYMESAFSCGMSMAMGARFYPVDNIYVEGMAGWKWTSKSIGFKNTKYVDKDTYLIHNITIPFHVGVSIPSASNISLGLFGGTRIDIPVSAKKELHLEKSDLNVPVTALIEVGMDIKFKENVGLRLQYDYSPSKSNKYSLISIGGIAGI